MENKEIKVIPKTDKKYFGSKELRVLVGNNEFIFITRDICDIIGISHYYISKLPVDHKQLVPLKTKTGAIQKVSVCNFKAIKWLLNVKPNDEFQQWLHNEYPNDFKIELSEKNEQAPKESILNITDNFTSNNKLTTENIKFLSDVMAILNSGNEENQEILRSLLGEFGLIKKSGQIS